MVSKYTLLTLLLISMCKYFYIELFHLIHFLDLQEPMHKYESLNPNDVNYVNNDLDLNDDCILISY